MADLGSIGSLGNLTKSFKAGNPALQPTGLSWLSNRTSSMVVGSPARRLQSINAGVYRLVAGAEDFTQGNPARPSLRMDAKGTWRFRWAFAVGQHSISVNVLHAINQSPRPSMVIKANPAVGIPIDVETFAPSGTGWVTINSPMFTATAIGATWVELKNNLETNVGYSPCYFDHVV